MSTRIAKFSLIVFVMLFVLSGFLLSVSGDYWPWYSVMAIFAVVPILVGPKRYRIFGIVALLVSVYLILGDIESGKLHRQRTQQIRDRWSVTNKP